MPPSCYVFTPDDYFYWNSYGEADCSATRQCYCAGEPPTSAPTTSLSAGLVHGFCFNTCEMTDPYGGMTASFVGSPQCSPGGIGLGMTGGTNTGYGSLSGAELEGCRENPGLGRSRWLGAAY